MLIRERRSEDREPLERLGAAVYRSDGYPRYLPETFGDFLVSADALGAWIATTDTGLVGHVALHPSSAPEVMAAARAATGLANHDLAVVARLLVSPTARRTGVGRALLGIATAAAAAEGRRAVLDVVTDHHSAIRLYDGAGWTRADTVTWILPDGSPLTEFVYLSPVSGPGQGEDR